MKREHVELLKEIVETPSPTGSEVAVAGIVRDRLLPIADEITTDSMGSVHATYEGILHAQLEDGEVPDIPLSLMFAAHMDEIGLMVTYISDDGFLSVAPIGGVDAAILPGMRVDVHAEGGTLRGVVGRKPIHLIETDDRTNVTPMDKLVIDLGMSGKAVKKRVKVGDSITMSVGFERFGKGMAVSRAFDDKVGVFIACRVMEKLASNPDYKGSFTAAITVQEEIGTRGAMTSAHAIRPDVALAFDVTHATDYPGIDKSKHGNIVCGGGPVIARGPNINPVVFERLVKAAEDEGIPYQLEAEPSVTGTDARAIQVTRDGIPTGLISIPLRYMHTPTEVISLDDVSATIKLIARFAADLDEAADFIPGHPEDYVSEECLASELYADDCDHLFSQVAKLTEDVSDLQALAGIDPGDDSEWIGLQSYDSSYDEDAIPDSEDAEAFVADEEIIEEDDAYGMVTEYAGAAFIDPEDDDDELDLDGVDLGGFDEDFDGSADVAMFEDSGLEDFDDDDIPAAYFEEDIADAPAYKLKLESEYPEEDDGDEDDDGDVVASQWANESHRTLPVVMMPTTDLEDDE